VLDCRRPTPRRKTSRIESIAFRLPIFDRARAEGETTGFAKLVTDDKGKILGGTIVVRNAGELIAEFALAIGKGLHAKDISNVIHTYPTLASIAPARRSTSVSKEGLTPAARTWIKRIFRLQACEMKPREPRHS